METRGGSHRSFVRLLGAPETCQSLLYPEAPLEVDPVASARCFFSPADEDEAERAEALAECAALKQLAVDYAHPESKVTTDGNTARCFFERASKEVSYLEEIKGTIDDQISDDEMCRQILADAAALKKLAIDYAHPELSVMTNGNMSRCYFYRSSAVRSAEELAAEEEVPEGTLSSVSSAASSPSRNVRENYPRALSDQFEIDMDFGCTLGTSTFSSQNTSTFTVDKISIVETEEDEENADTDPGKLSRSPSSIALFEAGLAN